LNVCLTQLRKKNKNVFTSREELPDIYEDKDSDKEERLELLYKAIKLLKESDRAIILLYLEEKSYKEMADILGITVTNVGAKVNRVKNQLKGIIDGRARH
jgi:RNA polymerase sigma-70 factor (ECF subfamily)